MSILEMLSWPFMQRALIAGVLVTALKKSGALHSMQATLSR